MQNCKKNVEKSEKKWSDRICWGLAGKKTGGGSANGERGIPGRQKVAHGSNVPALTSHASPNPRSKSGYEPERRVIKKDGPEARARAEDDLELDYEIRRKRVVRATILFLLPVNLAYCKWKKKEKNNE